MVVDAKTEMLRERLEKLEERERELADRVEDLETELERRDPAEVMLRQWEERRDWVWQQMRIYEQTIGSARGCGAVHVDPDWVSTEGKWRARRIELLNFVLDVEAAVRSLKECTAEDLGLSRSGSGASDAHDYRERVQGQRGFAPASPRAGLGSESGQSKKEETTRQETTAGVKAFRAFRMMHWGVPKRDDSWPHAEWSVGSIAKALQVSYGMAARLLARSVDIVWARLSDYRGGGGEKEVFTTEDAEDTE